MTGQVTESIFNGAGVIVPLADVQHIEKRPNNSIPGVMIITRHTHWDFASDDWSNAIWMSEPEATEFRSAWCRYRSELEADTLADLSPDGGLKASIMKLHDETMAMLDGHKP